MASKPFEVEKETKQKSAKSLLRALRERLPELKVMFGGVPKESWPKGTGNGPKLGDVPEHPNT